MTYYRAAPPKQTFMGTKSQDPMAIFFSNRKMGAPKLVEYSQYGLGMEFSQASRYSPCIVCTCLKAPLFGVKGECHGTKAKKGISYSRLQKLSILREG